MVKKRNLKIIISFVSIIVFFSLGLFLLFKGLNNSSSEQVGFKEKNNIDYKVFLKENNFFDNKFLTRDDNMAYITSLIDYLDINFNYDMILGERRSGNYTYSIKAIISAATQDKNSNYWTKEYTILDSVKKEFNNSNVINIGEHVKINYQEYNDLLMEFKRMYSLSIEGSLRISLNIETNVKNNINDEYMKSKVVSSLSIPLTKATIEVPIEINSPASEGLLNSGIVYHKGISYLIYKILGVIFLLASVVSLIYFALIFVKKGEQVYNYNKRLKHILKTYDEIIVNVSKIPNLEKLNVINVSKFEELLDAHGEIRLPINYCDSKEGGVFTLINENIAYCYTLKKK